MDITTTCVNGIKSSVIDIGRLLLIIACLFSFEHQAYSQLPLGSLACNNQLQVSVNHECEAPITPDMILEGSGYLAWDQYEVTIQSFPSNIVTRPGFFSVTVTEVPTGNYCWGSIDVEDKLPPIVQDCPCEENNNDPDCQFLCSDLDGIMDGSISIPTPQVVENCSNFTTNYVDEISPDQCENSLLVRKWIFKDEAGNVSDQCTTYYRIVPSSLDDVQLPPKTVQLTCGSDPSMSAIVDYFTPLVGLDSARAIAYPTINGQIITSTGACNLIAAKTDNVVNACGAECLSSSKIIRSWQIIDWCTGSDILYSQVIKASDATPPTIDAEDLYESTVHTSCYAIITFPLPTVLTDNCSDALSYYIEGPAGVNIIFDAAQNRYVATNAPKGIHTFSYIASDCCGNTSVKEIEVVVEDRQSPVAISKQFVVVSLAYDANGNGSAKVYTESIDNGSHDGCSDVHLEIRRDSDNCNKVGNTTYNNDGHLNDANNDPDDGAFVSFCCSDITDIEDGVPYGRVKVWLRVWDDADMNGQFGTAGDNYNETWSWVRVEDKSPASIHCPDDITISCIQDPDDISLTGTATGLGTCSNIPVDFNDVSNSVNTCGIGTIIRQWFIEDDPSENCQQIITIQKDQPFNGQITWPRDMTTDCNGVGEFEPTWNAGPCDLIGYNLDTDTFIVAPDACLKIANYYTVIDWCVYDPNNNPFEGIYTHTQIIKVVDEVKPEVYCQDTMYFTNDATDLDGDMNRCEVKGAQFNVSAADNGDCSTDWLQWVILVDINADNVLDFEYSSFLPRTDTNPNDSNNNQIPDLYLAPTMSNEVVTITLPDLPGPSSNHKISFKVRDGCGNYTNCTSDIIVKDDKNPTPYCINLSTAFMEDGTVELWARDFDIGSFDGCSPQEDLLFTFENESPVVDLLDEEHYFKGNGVLASLSEYLAGEAQSWDPTQNTSAKNFLCKDAPVAQVRMTVWDTDMRSDFCMVELRLVDNQGACDSLGTRVAISGRISNNSAVALDGAMVTLDGPETLLDQEMMSTEEGEYTFYNNPMYVNYNVSVSKEGDYMDGISTLDLIFIQRHILKLKELDTPAKLIAADINNDGKVSAADLSDLRKLILGIYNELPQNESWRFAHGLNDIQDPKSPWPFVEVALLEAIDKDTSNLNFTAIKIGDVNESIEMAGNFSTDNRSQTASLIIEDQELVKGEEYLVDVSLSKDMLLAGLQLELKGADLDITKLFSRQLDITESDYTFSSEGALMISHIGSKSVLADELAFTIRIKANTSGLLSDLLTLSYEQFVPEVYLADDLSTESLNLAFRRSSQDNPLSFKLLQNEPNPFTESTLIRFVLPADDEATLVIHDTNGRMIYKSTQQYKKGLNFISLNQSDLNTNGILFYTIESGSFTATKKMIDLK